MAPHHLRQSHEIEIRDKDLMDPYIKIQIHHNGVLYKEYLDTSRGFFFCHIPRQHLNIQPIYIATLMVSFNIYKRPSEYLK